MRSTGCRGERYEREVRCNASNEAIAFRHADPFQQRRPELGRIVTQLTDWKQSGKQFLWLSELKLQVAKYWLYEYDYAINNRR